MWRWKRMEKASGTDLVKHEEVLHVVNEEGNILHNTVEGGLTG